MFCAIDNVYDEDEERNWLKFPPEIAPIQVGVFPLMGKPELLGPATEIYESVMDSGLITQFDQGGSIGRRYRRQDEVGTPFCVTIDYDTLEDNTVTVRDRDSMAQVRISRDILIDTLLKLVKGAITFDSLS